MLDFKRVIKKDHYIKRVLSHKESSAVLHMGCAGGEYVLRLYDEAKPVYGALAGSLCANLPQVYEARAEEGVYTVYEEYIDGVALQEIIGAGAKFEPERVAQIAGEVCSAAAFLHGKGFIHRDIKPEHVMLTPDNRVVLVDLDAAMAIRPDKSNDTQLLGTAMYAAPEQFGLTRSDVRTDIYAMGIFINEIITGCHPAVIQLKEGKLARIIAKCISMNPADRYQSAEELATALRLAGGNKAKKRKGLIAGLSAVFAAVLIAAFMMFVPAEQPQGGREPANSENPADGSALQEQQGENLLTDVLPEGCLPLFKEGQRDPVYYNLKVGSQSAPLYTEDGELVDQTYEVWADKAVGEIIGWNPKYSGFTLNSTGTETGATGCIHAEKDGRHYAIPVVILGEPMGVYSELPDYADPGQGYLAPQPGIAKGDPESISWEYEKGEDTTLYIVLSANFPDLIPQCVNKYVTLEACSDPVNWPHPVYRLTFNNPDGGYTPFEVRSTYNIQVFRFYEK